MSEIEYLPAIEFASDGKGGVLVNGEHQPRELLEQILGRRVYKTIAAMDPNDGLEPQEYPDGPFFLGAVERGE